ncbi:signal transduction histidine kinase [Desulfosporosinus acidiphilus SJ4]|uniref:histidine kinase n=1 Tax=Desulfosporosinus acidiphilus (strain DSM 22704 / JCM 16185 / SJ4) TaxID=646529 RepID=I4D2V3_DESAJ|nr:HAMP domain-containing sensor histidine kinase [Desulfosporosinus acidiphilus]AFM40127.1 signal transduction histidine kinase [Desulfosporosinus acidiphilus SJ4]
MVIKLLKSLFKRLYIKIEHHKRVHIRKHQEFRRRHREFHKQQHQLYRQSEFWVKHRQFKRDHRSLRFLRPMSIIFNLIILGLLFKWVGIRSISIFFAIFIIIKEILQFIFLWRLEKRIFKPILKLQNGVEEIAQGNYYVQIESDESCDLGFIGLLVDSFNEMALKLQVGEKMKLEYEENRKTLIANISHDLKTPISSVQGYLEAILDGVVSSPEKVNKYLKTIYQNTVYIDKLIDDLFLFSKLDMQKLEFKFEIICIRAFMEDLMEEFKFELEERNIKFDYHNKMAGDCELFIDRKRINQAFKNIIGNAVKYGVDKELMINITLKRKDNVIVIDVEDNGPGIPADKLPYIFNRFYRIDSERTKDLMSTGLGLAIAKELVQAHGGTLSVSSIEQEGTCFSIKLPIMENNRNERGLE